MAYSLAGTTRPTVLPTPSVSHDDADHHEASVHAWIVAVGETSASVAQRAAVA
jgi:hypothetical protein